MILSLTPIPPGSTIGMIGGGQLGRMTALAAANLGYKVHTYTIREGDPAAQVSNATTVASYEDVDAMKAFAASVDVVTFEFENIPDASIRALEGIAEVCPGWKPLHVARNRLREKEFFASLGIATAPYRAVRDRASLEEAVAALGRPAILKTTELGYDGKGQYRIDADTSLSALWEQIAPQKAEWVLEGFVLFEREISVVIARGKDGISVPYAPSDNHHEGGILRTSLAPSTVAPAIAANAQGVAKKIADALDYIGVLAIEFFVEADGTLRVNEMAPRPHNSGHWTMDGALTSQFEQQVRAVCGLPLGDPAVRVPVKMQNLIGSEVKELQKYITQPNAKIHLYGKREAREGRKMGHVNWLGEKD